MHRNSFRHVNRLGLSCAAASILAAATAVSLATAAPLGPITRFDGTTARGKLAHVTATDCSRVRCDRDVPKRLMADLIVKVARADIACESGTYPASSSTVGGGGRITSTRRFTYTARHVDRLKHDPYGEPEWVSEEIRTTVIKGRFSADGQRVRGTYQESIDVHVVSGSPPPGFIPVRCDTGTVAYSAKRRR